MPGMGQVETTVPPLLPQIHNPRWTAVTIHRMTFLKKGSGTETADNNGSVQAAISLDPLVVYKDGEETVLDTDELTIGVFFHSKTYRPHILLTAKGIFCQIP